MRTGIVQASQIFGKLCPNGHRSCLLPKCWLTENEVSYALTLEAAHSLYCEYRRQLGFMGPSREAWFESREAKAFRRD